MTVRQREMGGDDDNSCQGTVHAEEASSAVVLGLQRSVYTFQPVQDLVNNTDFDKR